MAAWEPSSAWAQARAAASGQVQPGTRLKALSSWQSSLSMSAVVTSLGRTWGRVWYSGETQRGS